MSYCLKIKLPKNHEISKFMINKLIIIFNKNDNIHKNEVQNIGFGIPINFQVKKKKIVERNNEIML